MDSGYIGQISAPSLCNFNLIYNRSLVHFKPEDRQNFWTFSPSRDSAHPALCTDFNRLRWPNHSNWPGVSKQLFSFWLNVEFPPFVTGATASGPS